MQYLDPVISEGSNEDLFSPSGETPRSHDGLPNKMKGKMTFGEQRKEEMTVLAPNTQEESKS